MSIVSPFTLARVANPILRIDVPPRPSFRSFGTRSACELPGGLLGGAVASGGRTHSHPASLPPLRPRGGGEDGGKRGLGLPSAHQPLPPLTGFRQGGGWGDGSENSGGLKLQQGEPSYTSGHRSVSQGSSGVFGRYATGVRPGSSPRRLVSNLPALSGGGGGERSTGSSQPLPKAFFGRGLLPTTGAPMHSTVSGASGGSRGGGTFLPSLGNVGDLSSGAKDLYRGSPVTSKGPGGVGEGGQEGGERDARAKQPRLMPKHEDERIDFRLQQQHHRRGDGGGDQLQQQQQLQNQQLQQPQQPQQQQLPQQQQQLQRPRLDVHHQTQAPSPFSSPPPSADPWTPYPQQSPSWPPEGASGAERVEPSRFGNYFGGGAGGGASVGSGSYGEQPHGGRQAAGGYGALLYPSQPPHQQPEAPFDDRQRPESMTSPPIVLPGMEQSKGRASSPTGPSEAMMRHEQVSGGMSAPNESGSTRPSEADGGNGSGGSRIPEMPGPGASVEEIRASKKLVRKMKNREAAARSNLRRKQRDDALKANVLEGRKKIESLSARERDLRRENNMLRKMVTGTSRGMGAAS